MNSLYEEEVRIVLADDDEDDCTFFQEALKEVISHATLITVANGDSLMKWITTPDQVKPDIIFLDINMPLKNGKECLKEIRSIEQYKTVPLVMYSTSVEPEDIEWSFNNGANLYISKPIYFAGVVKCLKQVFSRDWQNNLTRTSKSNFYLNPAPIISF